MQPRSKHRPLLLPRFACAMPRRGGAPSGKDRALVDLHAGMALVEGAPGDSRKLTRCKGLLEPARARGSKAIKAEACYHLGRLNEGLAAAAKEEMTASSAPDAPGDLARAWVDAFYYADKVYHEALRSGYPKAYEALYRLHKAKTEEHTVRVGDLVRLHGLVSDEGKTLNGKLGSIVGFVEETGRFGVQIDGLEKPKYILQINLVFVGQEDDPTDQ